MPTGLVSDPGAEPPPPVDTTPLHRLLWADSVAVVGASDRPASLGRRVMAELLGGGFAGPVMPVTPTHSTVAGIPAVASIRDLEGRVDMAILAVADARLEEQLLAAIEAGVGGVTIFSPCVGDAADGSPLRTRLADVAGGADVAICGPNGMGFVNVSHRLRATGFYQPPVLEPGGVAFLSHSGSLFSAMLHNRRLLRFNLVVSTGQELTTTMDQYLDHLLGLETTRCVGMFMETIRRPEEMAAALERAAQADVPVVALKVGRTERARRAAATHSGALAGEDAVYDAFFSHHGVHRVETMDEMADTLEIFAGGRRARPGRLGAAGDSGGERTLLLDIAAANGVPLADISETTRARLSAVLEPGLEPDNPVDAWGTGHGHDAIFEEVLAALADDPAVGLVAFCVDLTAEEDPAEGYSPLISRLSPTLPVPLVVLGNLVSGMDPVGAATLRRSGIPVLEGTLPGLRAIRHMLDRARRTVPPSPPASHDPALRERWRARLAAGGPPDEAEGLALLADYGMEVVGHRVATDLDAVRAAARGLGYPVAIKTAAGITHKTETGGVHLDVRDEEGLAAAYRDLAERLGPRVLVATMAPAGVEMTLGIVRDPQFGPLVLVGAGGVLVEALADRVLAVPPLHPEEAGRLPERLRLFPLLLGHRGRPPADRAALTAAVMAVSAITTDLGDLLEGLDVNPVIVSDHGAIAVDALVIPWEAP